MIFSVYKRFKLLANVKDKPDLANFYRQIQEINAEVCGVSLATVKRICAKGKNDADFRNEATTLFKSPRIRTNVKNVLPTSMILITM